MQRLNRQSSKSGTHISFRAKPMTSLKAGLRLVRSITISITGQGPRTSTGTKQWLVTEMGLNSTVSSTPAVANQGTIRIQLAIEHLHELWTFTITTGENKQSNGKGCVYGQHPLTVQCVLCGRDDLAAVVLSKKDPSASSTSLTIKAGSFPNGLMPKKSARPCCFGCR